MIIRDFRSLVSFALAIGLTGCGGGGSSVPGISSTSQIAQTSNASTRTLSASIANSTSAPAGAVASPATNIAIDAGGGTAGSWHADEYGTGGYSATFTKTVDVSHVVNPAPQAVYQSQRTGAAISYSVPQLTPNGVYNLRLHFVESWFTAAGQRVFNVKVNGLQVLTNFDIFQAAGGINIAVAKLVTATADSTGTITIALSSTVNYAEIGGIEISAAAATATPTPAPTSAPTSTPTPVGTSTLLLNAGGPATGNWLADVDGSGGYSATFTQAFNVSHVVNPAPQAVYDTQETGANIAYTIPNLARSTTYNVRLDFAEGWFTAAGQRVFNVSINGAQVLSNFDIYQAAGGTNIAVAKSFTTTSDASGTIAIKFVSTVNLAAIAGIEITGAPGSATPPPTTTPAPTPTPSATNAPSGGLTVYSARFTGNTPFHHSIAKLIQAGANEVSSTIESNFWSQSKAGSGPGGGLPIWLSSGSDQAYAFQCPTYGPPYCNVRGQNVHYPAGATNQCQSDPNGCNYDYHDDVIDSTRNSEVDGWGGSPSDGRCLFSGNSINCLAGVEYALNGSGLTYDTGNGNNTAVAGAYAIGEFSLTAGDLLSPTINHALGVVVSCVSGSSLYPSLSYANACNGNPTPTVRYGMVAAIRSSVNLANIGGGAYCQKIFKAMQTYGFYPMDTGGGGINISVSNYLADTSTGRPGGTRLWDQVASTMDAAGDGNGTGVNFSFNCMQRIPSNDVAVYELNQGGTSALPAYYGYGSSSN